MDKDTGWLRERGRPARPRLVATVLLGELSGILLVLQTALLVAIGDGAMLKGRGLPELAPRFAQLLGVIALRGLTAWALKRSAFECASIVKRRLRAELVGGLKALGPAALARLRAGEIAGVIVDAVEALEGYYSGYLPQRAIASILPFTILAVVFPLDWVSGLVLVLTAVFLPLSMIVIGEEAHARNQRLWGSLARISGSFLDALRGLTTVKIFGAERRELESIERDGEEYRLATMSVLRIAFLSSFMLELITAVSIAIVAVLTGLRLLSGKMGFPPGYFILLVAPEYFLVLRSLGSQYHARMGATSAAERIRGLFESMPKAEGSPGESPAAESSPSGSPAGPKPSFKAEGKGGAPRSGAAEFKQVSFAYPGRPVLEDFSLSLEEGERLALVGPSGCGKSTVLLLLLALAKPQTGSILLGGRELSLLDSAELYDYLAWLPQRPTLFHGSIAYNIGLGRQGASAAEIARASRLAHVEDFAESLPRGLDTAVGEGGRSLSTGQVQRVALARLFLRSPRLLLLDEPTAHLDAASETLVHDSIRMLAEGRSLIMATHREARDVDRSLVMPGGGGDGGETGGEEGPG